MTLYAIAVYRTAAIPGTGGTVPLPKYPDIPDIIPKLMRLLSADSSQPV
jgi:hypothetical protein